MASLIEVIDWKSRSRVDPVLYLHASRHLRLIKMIRGLLEQQAAYRLSRLTRNARPELRVGGMVEESFRPTSIPETNLNYFHAPFFLWFNQVQRLCTYSISLATSTMVSRVGIWRSCRLEAGFRLEESWRRLLGSLVNRYARLVSILCCTRSQKISPLTSKPRRSKIEHEEAST